MLECADPNSTLGNDVANYVAAMWSWSSLDLARDVLRFRHHNGSMRVPALGLFGLVLACTCVPVAAQNEGAAGAARLVAESLDRAVENQHWRLIGPPNPAGRAWKVVGVPSQPKTLYVTTAGGGLWKTVNNGTTFEPIFNDYGTGSTGAIAIAGSNPEILWLGSGEGANTRANSLGDGVYKPTDGGRSWRKVLYLDDTTGCNDVQMDPQDPDVLYAGMWQRWRFGGGRSRRGGRGPAGLAGQVSVGTYQVTVHAGDESSIRPVVVRAEGDGVKQVQVRKQPEE